jgi:Spy/CpxP family protein refolding chaperone
MRYALLVGVFALAFVGTVGLGGSNGQEPKQPPKVEPKAKGSLPQGWGPLGLSADQKEKVYKVQAKYNDQIDKLEAEIKDLKAKMSKERLEILTAEQKKNLEDILKKKAGGQ